MDKKWWYLLGFFIIAFSESDKNVNMSGIRRHRKQLSDLNMLLEENQCKTFNIGPRTICNVKGKGSRFVKTHTGTELPALPIPQSLSQNKIMEAIKFSGDYDRIEADRRIGEYRGYKGNSTSTGGITGSNVPILIIGEKTKGDIVYKTEIDRTTDKAMEVTQTRTFKSGRSNVYSQWIPKSAVMELKKGVYAMKPYASDKLPFRNEDVLTKLIK